MAVLLAAAAMLLWLLGRGFTFYYDEWDFVLRRRAWDVGSFVLPHNEHLSIVPVALYKTLFETVGLHYGAYRALGIACHLVVVALLFVLARVRVGGWPALFVAAPFLVLGSGWEDVLWPFQIGFLGSLASGLGALLALDRRDRTGDIVAAALVAVALGSSSLGIPIALGVTAELMWQPLRRRATWITLVPLALYVAWWMRYSAVESHPDNILKVPRFVADSLAASVGGLMGLDVSWGRVLGTFFALAVWLFILRGAPINGRLVMLMTAALTFWVLTALARAQLTQAAEAPRYVYPGALLVVLTGVEVASGKSRVPGRLVGVLAVGALFAVWGNLDRLVDAADTLRADSRVLTSELGALEAAGGSVPVGFQPDPVLAPQITAGPYRQATGKLGSPAASPREIRAAPVGVRSSVDAMLMRAEPPAVRPATEVPKASVPPEVAHVAAVRLGSSNGCVVGIPQGPASATDLAVPAGGLFVRVARGAPADVRLRRFSDEFPTEAIAQVPGGSGTVLSVPDDQISRPWVVRLTPAQRFTVCRIG